MLFLCRQVCLQLTLVVFVDLRSVNYRHCPTLLVSLSYENGFPRRECENSDPVETSRWAPSTISESGPLMACQVDRPKWTTLSSMV